MLSDRSIIKALTDGAIAIDPEPDVLAYVQPASVDVRLGDRLILFSEEVEEIDPTKGQPNLYVRKSIPPQGFSIMPGEFLLGTTAETLTVSGDFSGEVTGKSSLGRLGLMVHSTAGFIDPGFSGKVTLEITNLNKLPIRLYAGMRIAQFKFFRLDTSCLRPYGSVGLGSHYQGQSDVTASRGWE